MKEQKTIKKEFSLEGKGLQTGKSVKIDFYPESENKGIIFKRLDIKESKLICLNDLLNFNTDRRSKIGEGSAEVETVEHVLAAIVGFGIDNIRLEMNSLEPPALDGSSLKFLEALEKSGIKKQKEPKNFTKIEKPIWVEKEDSFLGIFPSDNFKVSYFLEYENKAIGKQFFSSIIDAEVFEKEIAPARTFCLKEEAEALRKLGYGKGANFKNTLVMTENGPIENTLRFPDEPVRHKVLDLIGDLTLLGRPVLGRVMAARSGHKLNLELVKKIKENI